MDTDRSQRVARACAKLTAAALVDEDAGLDHLAQACLEFLPADAVRVTVHGPAGERTREARADAWPAGVAGKRAAAGRPATVIQLTSRGRRVARVELWSTPGRDLQPADLHLAQSFADILAAGLACQHILADTRRKADGLQQDLTDTVVIAQAAGLLATYLATTPAPAHALLEAQAAFTGRPVAALARDITGTPGSRASMSWSAWTDERAATPPPTPRGSDAVGQRR